MRVKINRNVCDAHLAFCERCLGQFLKYPYGYERHCFEELEEDGSDLLHIEMTSGDHTVNMTLNEHQREMLANEGWAYFVKFPVPIYREKTESPEEPK
jgi:hypothetical protein